MKKTILPVLLLFFAAATIFAQNSADPVSLMDVTIRELAGNLNKRLVDEKATTISLGQFLYMGNMAPLSVYWANQLSQELTNIPQKPYTVLLSGATGSDITILGEIIDVSSTVRVYTRLVHSSTRAIVASFYSDLARNEHTTAMLYSADNRGAASASAPRDVWEPDSFDNPATYEIGYDDNTPVMNRTFHNSDDEDFFILIPGRNGRLVLETTGSLDTLIYLYDANTTELLTEDDDSGSGYNARIRHNVQEGRRYIAMVKGYGSGNAGQYGFRAYFQD